MALKRGCYLQVHFSDDLKELLEKFSNKVGCPQSKVCEQILIIELPRYIESYCKKMEVEIEIQTKKTSQRS